jgi:negative regulator of sigma E activity
MNEALLKELQEASWRRPLAPEEQARLSDCLAANPEAQAAWEQDAALTEHLRALSPAPLSSNFTARVLQAVELELESQERAAQARPWRWRGLWRGWVPRFAVASLLLVLGMGGFYQQQAFSRAHTARNVALVTGLIAVAGPERLQDYEVIHAVPPDTDDDLLAALQ